MTTLTERIDTALPIEDTFAFVADFANSAVWDPGVATAERLDAGAGRTRRRASDSACDWAAGSRRWSTGSPSSSHRPASCSSGPGSGVSAVDDIRFEPIAGGTRVDYTADIRLGGLLRLVQPFLGRAFATLGQQRRRRHAADARRAGGGDRCTPASPGDAS